MDSAKPASELIEISIKKAIESQTNARDKLLKEKEEFIKEKERWTARFVKEKELWNAKYIKEIISHLGSIIEKNPTDSSKWYYYVLLDKNTLVQGIDSYKKSLNRLEKGQDIFDRAAERIHEHKIEISKYEKILTYMDIEQIKTRLDTLGYKLEESEEIVNIFWCIPSYKKVRYRLSCKI